MVEVLLKQCVEEATGEKVRGAIGSDVILGYCVAYVLNRRWDWQALIQQNASCHIYSPACLPPVRRLPPAPRPLASRAHLTAANLPACRTARLPQVYTYLFIYIEILNIYIYIMYVCSSYIQCIPMYTYCIHMRIHMYTYRYAYSLN